MKHALVILKRMSNTPLVLVLLFSIGCAYEAPPTSPTVVTPPPSIINPPPPLPPSTPVELSLELGREDVYIGEGVSLRAIPIKGEVFAPAVYDWTFGDGQTATTETNFAGHVYAQGGEYPASVRVRDRDGRQAEASTVVVVTRRPSPPRDPKPPTCPTITLSPSTLPNGTVGTNYSRTITASGGKSPYTFAASDLPPGLLLSTAGVLSGTPTTAGTYTFIIGAIGAFDRDGCEGRRSYTVTIADKPVMTATMSCTATSTTLNTASCNMTGTYNGAPVPSAKVTGVDWDWGDGDTETTAKPAQTHLYVHAGAYTVIGVMTADTANGPKTATASKTVTVPKPPPED